MTEIPDRPFDKIAMDLVTDFTESNKGNKHILTIIDLLTGWPEVTPIPNKSAKTITKAFIRHYLPRHMCPRFILSDNGTEFKNQIFDKVTRDLGIERIFSAPYHPQSNGKLETFHKFLKPTLKKMCADDQDTWDDYMEQVLGTYRGVPNLTTGESPFFLVYGRDGNQPVHQLLQPLTRFLGDPDSGLLCLGQHRLSLSVAKKYLDDHRFLTAEKTTDRAEPGFKVGDILSDNGTESKNQIFDKVTKDLGIERICSAPYHPQSNGKLETFHKFLKPTLKKKCAEDQDNWDDYVEQVLGTYRGVLNLMTGESPFFLVYGRDGNQPLHQLLQPLTRFLGDLDSGLLCLDQHRLSLPIAKKYLDDHRFLTAEKMTDRAEPGFEVGDRVYFKNKTPGKWDLKWRAGYRIVRIEHEGRYLHIENQATGKIRSCNAKDVVLEPIRELWNMNPEFGGASKFINHPNNLPDFTPDT